ncbi:MAG: hypothetical protein GY803_31340 [Chloroflexi bacterium]|nr:hypothetical protein [Chloroflexota bacterium]
MNESKAAAYRLGLTTLIVLAALTAVEYIVGISMSNPATVLFVIALVKAGVVVQNFMHVYRLWREESH